MSQKEQFVPKSFAFRLEQKGDLFNDQAYLYASRPDILLRAIEGKRKPKPKPVLVALSFQQQLVQLGRAIRSPVKHSLDFAKQ